MPLAVSVPAAYATAQTGSATGMTFDLGPSPIGLPPTCGVDNGDLNFLFTSGSVVFHDTSNANGDWGGETVQGSANLYDGSTQIAVGHLTIWGGGGNNARGQNEGGLTVNFSGSGDSGSIMIHVTLHQTVNAGGRPTANVANVQIVCS